MTDTREFPLADILSITTGRLLSRDHIGGVYRILNYLTGDDLFTHQLPRAAQACRPSLFAQHPQLVEARPPDGDGLLPLMEWLAEQERAYGMTLPVSPVADWEHRDALGELLEHIGPERVIVVQVEK
jgi:hypothetical protein